MSINIRGKTMYTLVKCLGSNCIDVTSYTTKEAAQHMADHNNKNSKLYQNNLYSYAVVKEEEIEII